MQLPAKALFYALLITLLIAMISSSLLLMAYTQRLQQERYFMQERLMRNSASGMTLLMADPSTEYPERIIDLYGKELDSVTLSKQSWGFFSIARSLAFTNTLGLPQQVEQMALLGQTIIDDSTALYLAENNKALSLCGSAVIRGNAYLPKAGVKRTQINGQNYVGDRLIYGDKRRSDRNLPELDLSGLEVLYSESVTENTNLPIQLNQPFDEGAQYFHGSSFDLDQQELRGRVVIWATDEIRVKASCVLEDVILMARKIVIEEGFQGRLQAIATDSLMVGRACVLDYPSVLCLWDREEGNTVDLIQLDRLTQLNGGILVKDDVKGKYPVKAHLQDSVLVHGEVFVDGVVQLKGTVEGSLYTKGFVLKTASSIYDNHVLSGTIDVDRRSPYYLGARFRGDGSWGVAVWLD